MVKLTRRESRGYLKRYGSQAAVAVALFHAGSAAAQTSDAQAASAEGADIVVTGTRIEKVGFDQPTPTTIVSAQELRDTARPNIQQALNEMPQFRPSIVPQNSNGNVNNSGNAPADLRGLGVLRTLTLLNGRRFIGQNNLNFVPFNMVRRVDVVTGGASAGYGSGAVAGVVNIILNDKLSGLSLNAQTGISSRGDARRYAIDGSFGTSFADDRAHFMVGFEYVDDKGIPPHGRASRPFLGAGTIRVDQTSATDLRTHTVPDVNFGNTALGGLITSGVLAGMVFNADGTLRSFREGTQIVTNPALRFQGSMIGGEDGTSQYDNMYLTTPNKRITSYARASYDLGGATLWVDGAYGRTEANYPFLYDPTIPALTISVNNGYLPTAVRDRMIAAGETSFTMGRYLMDAYTFGLRSKRQTYEGAIGIEGDVGGFKYRAHYSHGEMIKDEHLDNSRLAVQYANALNAVRVGDKVVCGINADADPANDDPACEPINPFGYGNVSDAALAYTTATQSRHTRSQLDSAGAQVQGDLFRLPGGTVTMVVGGEWRSERQSQNIYSTKPLGQFALPVLSYGLNGKVNVKEVYSEIAVPVFDFADTAKLDLSGAARYSDYSNTGGIWSWKVGGTLRLFNDLLLRGLRSRDIRSPAIDPELFTPRAINMMTLSRDDQQSLYADRPGYNANPTITTYTGGNPTLNPEIAKTITFGATYSSSWIPGLNLSADYYDISIEGAVGTMNAPTLIQACAAGNAAACSNIVRDSTGTVTTAYVNYQNLSYMLIRGLDFEASYTMPLSQLSEGWGGSLRIRGLVNRILKDVTDNGITRNDTTKNLGRTRARLSIAYQGDSFGIDARLRYIGGGMVSAQNAENTVGGVTRGAADNHRKAWTYLDLGAQFRVHDQFTLFGNVNNVFNKAAPLETQQSSTYDHVGTYYTFGVRTKF